MRQDDIINGYRILQDFQTAGGGLSKWTFAERDGEEYFIKEFLHPTYPLPDSPGSEKVKTRKRGECQTFEDHQNAIKAAIDARTVPGGNLISALDFFRWGAKYYKVTHKVDVTSLKPAQIASLPLSQRILIMTTTAHSLRILHKADIVHGDLKLDNVLIKKTRMGSYTTKLIDFDSSYFSKRPPAQAENVVGDMVFYSPELARYIREEPGALPETLTTKSDIFALGLLYSLYLTGRLPDFDKGKYRYAWIWAMRGNELKVPDFEDIPDKIEDLIRAMLSIDPAERPEIGDIFDILRSMVTKPKKPEPLAKKEPVKKSPPKKPSGPTGKLPVIGTELKGKMAESASAEVEPEEDEGLLEERFVSGRKKDDPELPGGLRGTLLGRKD